jgi:hypothetical protein
MKRTVNAARERGGTAINKGDPVRVSGGESERKKAEK